MISLHRNTLYLKAPVCIGMESFIDSHKIIKLCSFIVCKSFEYISFVASADTEHLTFMFRNLPANGKLFN